LITPSLDEMVHVGREMQRLGMTMPVLIGGATTSRLHTAVKIDPVYDGPVLHVVDASRSVGVVSRLLSRDLRVSLIDETREDYARIRTKHQGSAEAHKLLPIADARGNAAKLDFAGNTYRPAKPGLHEFDNYPLDELRKYIDWSPFFQAWELAGKYPAILKDKKVGKQAKALFDDANRLLDEIVEGKLLAARGVIGLWPANRHGDDIEVYADESRGETAAVLHTLRQQFRRGGGMPNVALADYVAPQGTPDWIGGFCVTAGIGLDALVQRFEKDHDDYHAIMAKALADRLAEAFAERLHERVRREFWACAPNEDLSLHDLVAEKYQGIRPAPGYPACPDHSEKATLFKLLDASRATGVTLTENFAMYPTAAVSGFYFAHPQAKYFGVGKLGLDQVEDYAQRKGISAEEAQRWLTANLGYEPAPVAQVSSSA
jgi:5-methyltetrahydrofolate--homocysteine methyltransferase